MDYRCAPIQTYFYQDSSCDNAYDLECGADCHKCVWSWANGDAGQWSGETASCRCQPEQIKEVSWGEPCPQQDDGECGSYCRDCRMSYLTYEEASPNTCRCRNWW